MTHSTRIQFVAALGAVSALFANPAYAYLGPGAGLGAFAFLAALAVGVLLLFVGLIYFPVKRMIKNRRNATLDNDAGSAEPGDR